MIGNAQDVAKKILKSNDIAIYAHTSPDGDALGSALALYVALKRMGKTVCVYCDTPIESLYDEMYGIENVTFPEKRSHNLGISVDSSELDRLGQCMRSFLSCKEQIAIDHHKTFKKFASTCLVDTDVASCAEVVYYVIKEMKSLDKEVASLLFSGIVTDSACLSLLSVNSRTYEIVANLTKYGFDSQGIIYKLYRSLSSKKFDLKKRVFQNVKFYNNSQVAMYCINKDDYIQTGTVEEDGRGFINEVNNISSVKITFALTQAAERSYKISIRTKGNIDASQIANIFGGGGHMRAAGCRINGYREDIEERLLKIANDWL